jgi:D-alanyl-D-alanine carboxypeptidase/D-alanyl-D-alanine-endopeptidase (penicillin-binding protein 4)
MRNNVAFVNSLPLAGRDKGYGTLCRRMKRTPAEGNLKAKTGSLEGVSTLPGYVRSLDGKTLAFSIMTNATVGDLARVRRFQDRLGIAMATNLVKDLPTVLLCKCSALRTDATKSML